MEPLDQAHEARELIRRCLSGNDDAVRTFQTQYGELIYGYPMRVYGTPPEEAAGFYVYAFENARLFRRLRTFKGHAPLRAYLLAYVLDHLVVDWKRAEHEVETVSIETMKELAEPEPYFDPSQGDGTGAHPVEQQKLSEALALMPPAKAVVLKLLYIEDCTLSPADIQYVAKTSGHRVREVIAEIERLRTVVREREAVLKQIEDSLDAVQAWIELHERRLHRVNRELEELSHVNGSRPAAAERLAAEQSELQRKIRRRHEQRRSLLERAQRRKVTTPYKDLAVLLNTSGGNLASLIARARRDLAERLSQHDHAAGGYDDHGTP